jgi:hypothetical protein
MSSITNDSEFGAALENLSIERQRAVGALFVENVLGLNDDDRVAQALAAARDPDISNDVMTMVRHAIKAASLEAHARCGADGKWTDQAGYFVARAAEACVEPQVLSKGKGPGWKAAMSARMAKTCLAAEGDEDAHDSESQAQYQILTRYLDS